MQFCSHTLATFWGSVVSWIVATASNVTDKEHFNRCRKLCLLHSLVRVAGVGRQEETAKPLWEEDVCLRLAGWEGGRSVGQEDVLQAEGTEGADTLKQEHIWSLREKKEQGGWRTVNKREGVKGWGWSGGQSNTLYFCQIIKRTATSAWCSLTLSPGRQPLCCKEAV